MSRGSRLRRFGPALLFASALAAAALAVPVTAGAAGPTTTTVRVQRALCSAPAAGHASCDAVRLVTERVSTTRAARMQAHGLARPASLRDIGFGPAGGYSPAQLATAYGVNPAAATTQTVAIVDAFNDPTVLADLNEFDAYYRLPAETSTSFRVVNQAGGSTLPTADSGWAGEITLDVQAVRGLCHHCKILLVEGNSSSNSDLGTSVNTAVKLGATIVSNSYGDRESDPLSQGSIANDYNHPRVAILASTGDHGWYGWDWFNEGCPTSCGTGGDQPDGAASVPASYSTVVGVGGTSLYLNPDGTRASETVWNEDGPGDAWGYNIGQPVGAAGSGCSTLYAPQRWQARVSGYASLNCKGKRSGVDIAAVADPFTGYDICQNYGNTNGTSCGWETIGGTSLASPVVAALWGLAGGPGGVTSPALSLYGHYQSDRKRPTYDVTVGGTGMCDTLSTTACTGGNSPNTSAPLDCGWDLGTGAVVTARAQCYAQPGYDGVSGVGTPEGLNVFKPMNPTAVITTALPVTHRVSHKYSAAGSKDPFPGGYIAKYLWKWGYGMTSTGRVVYHTYPYRGTKTITLVVTDNYGRSASRRLTITVR